MKVVLFDPSNRHWLYPFTLIRSLADLRKGIGTIRETWERLTAASPIVLTASYLSDFGYSRSESTGHHSTSTGPHPQPTGSNPQPVGWGAPGPHPESTASSTLFINAALMPNVAVWAALKELPPGQALFTEYTLVALCVGVNNGLLEHLSACDQPPIGEPGCVHKDIAYLISRGFHFHLNPLPIAADILMYPWQLIQWNDKALRADFSLFTAGKITMPVPPGNQVIGAENIFIEEGARVSCSVLNAVTGPIYIGKNAEIMEGCLIRGPLAMGEGAILKMGTKVYGATTLGPYSVAGGELKNVIMTGHSNKGHDGYLGDALLGEWCNLGEGTSNSNVRNNATAVRVWNPGKGVYEIAGPKAGLLMGDYSRSAIQTAFNTGAVVGICCNIFGGGLCSGYVPDFSWGATRYECEKVLRDIDNWKKLKGRTLTEREIQILRHIFEPSITE